MITTLFLIIAYFRRKRFLSENAFWADKMLYYILSVALTPYFGPKCYIWLNEESRKGDNHNHNGGCAMPPPNLFM